MEISEQVSPEIGMCEWKLFIINYVPAVNMVAAPGQWRGVGSDGVAMIRGRGTGSWKANFAHLDWHPWGANALWVIIWLVLLQKAASGPVGVAGQAISWLNDSERELQN